MVDVVRWDVGKASRTNPPELVKGIELINNYVRLLQLQEDRMQENKISTK